MSREQVTVGEQFSFEGEVKNTGTENVRLALLSIYVSRPGLEVVEVKPFKPLKDIELRPEETLSLRFELKPREAGTFNVGFTAIVEDGPILRSQTLAVDAIGRGVTIERTTLLLLFGALAIGGIMFVIWKWGKKENAFKLAYWREKWYLTLVVLSYVCVQVFLPYLLRILPRDVAYTVESISVLYVESIGWWLVTPVVLALHGYTVRHAVKSFVIAFIPFLVYGVYSELEIVYYIGAAPAINFGFILYEAYLGISLGLIGAASAILHFRKWIGTFLLVIGWILLLLRPSGIFF